jgi:hypothetical protein
MARPRPSVAVQVSLIKSNERIVGIISSKMKKSREKEDALIIDILLTVTEKNSKDLEAFLLRIM